MRHTVLAAVGLGLLLAGCSQSSSSKSWMSGFQEKKKVNTIGVRMLAYGKYQEAGWSHLPTIGVRNVEIPVPPPDQIDAVKQKLADHGLTAVLLTGKTDLSKSESVGELAGQLRVCEQMGVKYMFLSAKSNGAPKELVYNRLRQAGEIAHKHSVTIVLETHPDLCVNGDVALQTMKAVNHPNVRVNFDTGNIYFYNQNVDVVAELKKIMPYVASVHLKDIGAPAYQTWNFPALGAGMVNFPGVIELLNERDFTGPFVIEIEGIKGTEWDEATTTQTVADSLVYLRKIGQWK